jgi:hypothetical protein
MTNTRRAFLAQACALPLAFGLPLCGCERAGAPAWLVDALRRLRADGRLGLALRLPAAKDARCGIGHAISHYLLSVPDADVHEVLAEAALLCLDGDALQASIRGVRPADTLVLVDGDGYAVDGLAFRPKDDWSNFVPSARALLHGAGGARLAERAAAARRRAPAEAVAALDQPVPDAAALGPSVGTLIPALVKERLAAPAPRAARLREAVEAYWSASPPAGPGPRMPYGVETTAQMRGGCGACGCEEAPPRNAMVACGMAAPLKNARYFVKFLTT